MYKNEQKEQFTVIHVQGNHVHLKDELPYADDLVLISESIE